MRRRVAALAAAALLLLPLALPSGAAATTTITMAGPYPVNSLMSLLAEEYVHYGLRFSMIPTGKEGGIRKAAKGEVQIGIVARSTPPQRSGLRFTRFARQAACVITNPANPVPSLTRAEIGAIFSGEIRNWDEVPGARESGAIDLLVAGDSLQYATPLERRLGLSKLSPSAEPETWDPGRAKAVAENPAAISYLSPSMAEANHLVGFNGVPCTRPNVESSRYPVSTSFFWVTKGPVKGEAKKFLNWARTSPEARRRIESEAYAVR